jgi:hypothetical protein
VEEKRAKKEQSIHIVAQPRLIAVPQKNLVKNLKQGKKDNER